MSLRKYSQGKENPFNKSRPFKNIAIGRVVKTGKVDETSGDEAQRARNRRFNADKHAIRVRLIGADLDNSTSDGELSNCFPLLPKHLNFVPQENELVLVVMFGEDGKDGDRFYIGPFISSDDKMNFDGADGTAMASFTNGITDVGEDIENLPKAKGTYENPQHVVIEGRGSTDIIQRDDEILIRAGKFKFGKRKEFNDENPGYIQIKYNQPYNKTEWNEYNITNPDSASKPNPQPFEFVTVTNIISNKINLLSYDNNNTYGLTSVDKNQTGAALYITDEEMDKILNEAHPLVFGDLLLQYLKAFREAFENHIHDTARVVAEDKTDKENPTPVRDFKNIAKDLESKMLSKNIRIN